MTEIKPSALFVCVHNAGRSQMAAGYLRHLSGGAVQVLTPEAVQASDVDWKLDDPAGQGIESVRSIRDEIKARVLALLEELGVEPVA